MDIAKQARLEGVRDLREVRSGQSQDRRHLSGRGHRRDQRIRPTQTRHGFSIWPRQQPRNHKNLSTNGKAKTVQAKPSAKCVLAAKSHGGRQFAPPRHPGPEGQEAPDGHRRQSQAERRRRSHPPVGHHDARWRALLQSFDIVARGSTNAGVTKLLNDIRTDVETGTSLSNSFRKHPCISTRCTATSSKRVNKPVSWRPCLTAWPPTRKDHCDQ